MQPPQASIFRRSQTSQQSRQALFSSYFRPYLINTLAHCSSQFNSQFLLLLLLPRSQIRWPRRSETRKHVSIIRRPRPRPSTSWFRFKRWIQFRSVLIKWLASTWSCSTFGSVIGIQSFHTLEWPYLIEWSWMESFRGLAWALVNVEQGAYGNHSNSWPRISVHSHSAGLGDRVGSTPIIGCSSRFLPCAWLRYYMQACIQFD